MPIKILHTNDMHGTLTDQRFAFLKDLRDKADLYFDSGDVIKTGNLGIPLRQEVAWTYLDRLQCTASVLGNRETHVLESAFQSKLAGSTHPVLCSNLRRKDSSRPLPTDLLLEVNGLKVGIFAVMVQMVTERMKTQALSVYLWDSPVKTAIEQVAKLRPQVDLLICLSHIGHRQDLELAKAVDGIDVILGGHSHTVLTEPIKVGNTFICQGGSHNRFVGLYEWDATSGLTGTLIPIPAS